MEEKLALAEVRICGSFWNIWDSFNKSYGSLHRIQGSFDRE